MPNKIIKFDLKTKQLVNNLITSMERAEQEAENQLCLICQVYLNVRGKNCGKNDFELAPDRTGLIKIKKKQKQKEK